MADAEIVPIDGAQQLPDPVPVISGSFALFDTPGGAIHVAVRLADGSEHHVEIPAFLAGVIKSGEISSPMDLVKVMAKNRKALRGLA